MKLRYTPRGQPNPGPRPRADRATGPPRGLDHFSPLSHRTDPGIDLGLLVSRFLHGGGGGQHRPQHLQQRVDVAKASAGRRRCLRVDCGSVSRDLDRLRLRRGKRRRPLFEACICGGGSVLSSGGRRKKHQILYLIQFIVTKNTDNALRVGNRPDTLTSFDPFDLEF
jgi:hypothetical protein